MLRLSIVIPCPVFNEQVEDTLVSVLANRPPNCQILVVTAGPYADPYRLSGEVDFIEEDPRATFVQLVNRGFRAAGAAIVHVLSPGTRAVEGWTDAVLSHFDDEQVAAVAPVAVRKVDDQRALWSGLGYWQCGVRRTLGRGKKVTAPVSPSRVIGPSLAAGFYRRHAVEALDYFDERMEPACADVEMALALRAVGWKAALEPACRVLSVPSAAGPPRSFQAARHLERIYLRYRPQGRWVALLHACVVAWDVLHDFPHPRFLAILLGRIAGRLETGIRFRNDSRLAAARLRLTQAAHASRAVSIRVDFSQERRSTGRATRRERQPARDRVAPSQRQRRAA